MSTTPSRLLKPDEVAERLQVSVKTVYRLCQDGKLPTTRIGGTVRIPEDMLELWLAAQTTPATEPMNEGDE